MTRKTRRRTFYLFLLTSIFCFPPHIAFSQSLELFELNQVELLDSPFARAQQTNVDYLLNLDKDRLLAPFLQEAGLPSPAEPYGNWESSGLNGHIGGHYLTALSLAGAATGDERLKNLLDDSIGTLRRAQLANGNGYIGGVPDGEEIWQQIHDGEIDAQLFSLNDRWVPWYNLHKIYAGLRDAYKIGNNEIAKQMLIELGEWTQWLVEDLSDEQIQTMLQAEHGGMNEVLVDLAEISGDNNYLTLAKRFSHRLLLEPLQEKNDILTGMHANTQIPKVVGFTRIAEHEDNSGAEWLEAASFFWRTVTHNRSVSIGGNSVREHFHEIDDYSSMVEDIQGPETCNTHNMLRLSKLLFKNSGDTEYLDYYERATFNHILSSQHPEHGGLVYFTPMRPGHYRIYSAVDSSMWCCVGSGIENHSKYGELIYSHRDRELLVNLFIPSKLNWSEQGLQLSLTTEFPDREQVAIRIEATGKEKRTISIRKPIWLAGAMDVTVNDKHVNIDEEHEGYVSISRRWREGDEIRFSLTAQPRVEGLRDDSNYYSVLYGPIVLATKVRPFLEERINFVADDSRMGHVPDAAPFCPPSELPIMLGEPKNFLQGLQRIPGPYLAYYPSSGIVNHKAHNVQLIPFFRLHDSRYQVYWPQMNKEQLATFTQQAEAQQKIEQALNAITLDQVNPGEQQPEVEHGFKGEGSNSGTHHARHWRSSDDWFSYQLRDPRKEAKILRLTYFGGDQGKQFEIWFNQHKLADVILSNEEGENFYQTDYPIPKAWLDAGDGEYELRFSAKPGSSAGRIFGIRLLKE